MNYYRRVTSASLCTVNTRHHRKYNKNHDIKQGATFIACIPERVRERERGIYSIKLVPFIIFMHHILQMMEPYQPKEKAHCSKNKNGLEIEDYDKVDTTKVSNEWRRMQYNKII